MFLLLTPNEKRQKTTKSVQTGASLSSFKKRGGGSSFLALSPARLRRARIRASPPPTPPRLASLRFAYTYTQPRPSAGFRNVLYIYIVTDRNLEYVFGNATKVPVYREVPVAQIFFWLIVTICRAYASKWLFRNFYEYFLDFLLNEGTRGLRISLQHGLEDVAAVSVIYANLPNLPGNPFPLLPNGPPSSPEIINTRRSF